MFICSVCCKNQNRLKAPIVNDKIDYKTDVSKSVVARKLNSKYKIYSIEHADMHEKTVTDTTCIIGNNKYTAVKKGYLLINKDTIHLESEMYLEKTFITESDENIYIFYTSEVFDVAGSKALCINKKNLKINWCHSIGGFNLSKPIMDNDVAYIASLDHLSKLSLKTGQFYWRLDGLYNKYKINYVEKVIFKDGLNLYVYKEEHPSKGYDTLYVDDLTGGIIKNSHYKNGKND